MKATRSCDDQWPLAHEKLLVVLILRPLEYS